VIQVCARQKHVAFCSKSTHPFPACKKHYTRCAWAGGTESEWILVNKVQREVFCVRQCAVASHHSEKFCSAMCCVASFVGIVSRQ